MRRYCSKCGAAMVLLKTESSWTTRWRCRRSACGLRVEVIEGDQGARGAVAEYDEPFDSEIPERRHTPL